MQRHVSLHGAEITEECAADHVVSRQREVVLGRVEPLESTADRHAHVLRRSAAELESADRGETAGKVVLEDGSVGARNTELGDQAGRVSARAIRPLANEEVLCPFEVAAREAKFAEGLLERTGHQMALRR